MGKVNCLYCGRQIPDDVSECPHCGAVSHYQRKGWAARVRARFVILFVLLAIASICLALWLPRSPLPGVGG